jgi:prepilin-type N-terminal cleavage/methylation domain-containing protein
MKKPRKIDLKDGFTIVEVVLVLAIAGLIFLMVFIALPALQRSQRDTQRKDDLARVQTAVNSYQSNNRGQIPFSCAVGACTVNANFEPRYIITDANDAFEDPDGTPYTFAGILAAGNGVQSMPATINTFDHVIRYVVGATCDATEGNYVGGQGLRKVALFYRLEGGAIICVNN